MSSSSWLSIPFPLAEAFSLIPSWTEEAGCFLLFGLEIGACNPTVSGVV